eukprot:SAG31_NODE_281_length_18584_cov_10.762564_8_plen_99_part_00
MNNNDNNDNNDNDNIMIMNNNNDTSQLGQHPAKRDGSDGQVENCKNLHQRAALCHAHVPSVRFQINVQAVTCPPVVVGYSSPYPIVVPVIVAKYKQSM